MTPVEVVYKLAQMNQRGETPDHATLSALDAQWDSYMGKNVDAEIGAQRTKYEHAIDNWPYLPACATQWDKQRQLLRDRTGR